MTRGQVHHSTARCAICGRALSRPGHVVPGVGEVGPEYRHRLAVLEAFLQREGFRDALYGGAVCPDEAILRVYGFVLRARVGRKVLVPRSALVEFVEQGGVEQVLYGHVAVRKARVEALA